MLEREKGRPRDELAHRDQQCARSARLPAGDLGATPPPRPPQGGVRSRQPALPAMTMRDRPAVVRS